MDQNVNHKLPTVPKRERERERERASGIKTSGVADDRYSIYRAFVVACLHVDTSGLGVGWEKGHVHVVKDQKGRR